MTSFRGPIREQSFSSSSNSNLLNMSNNNRMDKGGYGETFSTSSSFDVQILSQKYHSSHFLVPAKKKMSFDGGIIQPVRQSNKFISPLPVKSRAKSIGNFNNLLTSRYNIGPTKKELSLEDLDSIMKNLDRKLDYQNKIIEGMAMKISAIN
jgi:hypothetical protein